MPIALAKSASPSARKIASLALVGVALPRVHDEGVVDGDDGDGVDALVLHGIGRRGPRSAMHLWQAPV